MRVAAVSAFVLLVTSGCLIEGPNFEHRPVLPSGWANYSEGADSAAHDSAQIPFAKDNQDLQIWWATFDSPVLTSLTEVGLKNNRSIQAGIARLEQSRAVAIKAAGPLFPQIGISAGVSRSFSDSGGAQSGRSRLVSAGPTVSYEIDLWGKNRATADAADERVIASSNDLFALALTTTAEIARTFMLIEGLSDRLKVAHDNQRLSEDLLKLLEIQAAAGSLSDLEVAQQQTSLATVTAGIEELERQRTVAQNQLAVLIGRFPEELAKNGGSLAWLTTPSIVPFRIEELLVRRPDIRSAEHQLLASQLDVVVARAAIFPALQLSFDSLLSASTIGASSSVISSLAASVAQPIFRGGSLQGEIDRAKARREELMHTYQQVVLTAAQEVEDSLVSVRRNVQRRTALEGAVQSAQRAYDIARIQFEKGSINYLTVLDTQRSLLQATDSLVQAQLDTLTATVSLYKALGGGW